jgi:hypothetical protein
VSRLSSLPYEEQHDQRNLVYANADLSKSTQVTEEVVVFCDHWREATGVDPPCRTRPEIHHPSRLANSTPRGVRFLTCACAHLRPTHGHRTALAEAHPLSFLADTHVVSVQEMDVTVPRGIRTRHPKLNVAMHTSY